MWQGQVLCHSRSRPIICVLFQCGSLTDTAHQCFFSAFNHPIQQVLLLTIKIIEICLHCMSVRQKLQQRDLQVYNSCYQTHVGQNVKFVTYFAAVRTEPQTEVMVCNCTYQCWLNPLIILHYRSGKWSFITAWQFFFSNFKKPKR